MTQEGIDQELCWRILEGRRGGDDLPVGAKVEIEGKEVTVEQRHADAVDLLVQKFPLRPERGAGISFRV